MSAILPVDTSSIGCPNNTKSRKDLPPNPPGFFMWWLVSSTLCGHQHHFLHRKVSRHFLFPTTGREFAAGVVARHPNLFQEITVAVTMEDQLRFGRRLL